MKKNFNLISDVSFYSIFSGKFCDTTIIETNRYILDTADDDRSHLPIKDPKRFEGRTIDD